MIKRTKKKKNELTLSVTKKKAKPLHFQRDPSGKTNSHPIVYYERNKDADTLITHFQWQGQGLN